MDKYCIFYKNICYRLPSPVNCCDKLGFCFFSCMCLCIPNCIDYFLTHSNKSLNKNTNTLSLNPAVSYDDFMMSDTMEIE